jgi:hypothetical protein
VQVTAAHVRSHDAPATAPSADGGSSSTFMPADLAKDLRLQLVAKDAVARAAVLPSVPATGIGLVSGPPTLS